MVAHDESFSECDEEDELPPSNKSAPRRSLADGSRRHQQEGGRASRPDDGSGGRRPWAPAGSPQVWRGVTQLEPPPRPPRSGPWADIQPRVNLKRPHEIPPQTAAASGRRSSASPGRRSRSPERASAGGDCSSRAVLRLSFRGRPLNRTRRVSPARACASSADAQLEARGCCPWQRRLAQCARVCRGRESDERGGEKNGRGKDGKKENE